MHKEGGRIPLDWNFYLPRSSPSCVGIVKTALEWGIIPVCKHQFVVEKRGWFGSTTDRRKDWTGAPTRRRAAARYRRRRASRKELDGFISRRHDQRVRSEGERAVEESWRESERREEARRAEEEHAGRIGVFRHLQRVYAARSRECGHAAAELEEMA